MDQTALSAQASRVRNSRDSAPRSIVIVGGGFAGAALAYHLLRRPSPLRVTLIERSAHVGRGRAYAVVKPILRLNVPAARMSMDPSQPDDFVRFAGCAATPHRAPPDVLAEIETRQAAGRLHVLAGRVLACHARKDSIDVNLRLHGGAYKIERFSHVVRCLGPTLAFDPQSSPFVAALVRTGLAQCDPTGLGITTLECGRLVDGAGQPSRQLFAIGQPCRASRWETTSVP